MNILRMVFLLSGFFVFFAACAPPFSFQIDIQNDLPNKDLSTGSIIDGALLSSRSTTAAKSVIYLEFLDQKGEQIGYCSGALVGKRTVLTAGHCFDPTLVPGVKSFNVVFEAKIQDSTLRIRRQGLAYSVHPRYDTESRLPRLFDHDLAVLVFAGDLPAGFNPVSLDSDMNADYSNTEVYVYGFGRVSDYQGGPADFGTGGAGYLRRGIMKLDDSYKKTPDRYFISTLSSNFVCQGDSGGPQFFHKKDVLKLIGVNSASMGRLYTNGKQSCRGPSQATKVAPAYSWIMSEQKKLLNLNL